MSFNSLLHNFRSALAPSRDQRKHGRRTSFRTDSHWLRIEILEDRSLLSAVAFGDFNNDGLMDKAAITGQKTITVSLANPDGSYRVSAKLTVPKAIQFVAVTHWNGDGKLDLAASGSKPHDTFGWLGNGDGTFQKPFLLPDGF